MTFRTATTLLGAAALLVPQAAPASSGSIDATHTTADFTGTITEPTGIYDAALSSPVVIVGGDSYDTCKPPLCDEHALTIGEGAARLRIDATSDAKKIDFELVDPTGYTIAVNDGTLANRTFTWDSPTPGPWTLRVWGVSNAPSSTYDVKATFVPPADPGQGPA